MGAILHRHVRHHYHCLLSAISITFLVITSAASSASFTITSQKHPAKTKKPLNENSSLGPSGQLETQDLQASGVNAALNHDMAYDQKRVIGPAGSSPPSCRSKCGRCKPCKPVHVLIQPGMGILLEYYPEAWRCKCGNKLFMP